MCRGLCLRWEFSWLLCLGLGVWVFMGYGKWKMENELVCGDCVQCFIGDLLLLYERVVWI